MAHNPKTVSGQILGVVISMTSTFNACSTTLGYWRIRSTVLSMKKKLKAHKTGGSSNSGHPEQQSTASKCLTTYVWVAACLYCPLALMLWINVLFEMILGAVEPLSSLFVVIVANSSGWANAFGYFHNEQLKKGRARAGKSGNDGNSTVSATVDSNSSSRDS